MGVCMDKNQLLERLQETHQLHAAIDSASRPRSPNPDKWQQGLRMTFSDASMNSVVIGQLCDVSKTRGTRSEIRALAGAVLGEIFAHGVSHKDAARILEAAHVLRAHNAKGLSQTGERLLQKLGVGTN